MALYYAQGSPTTEISDREMEEALFEVLRQLGPQERVIALPPDFTRYNSRAGKLTCMVNDFYDEKLVDIMPALGTHVPMPAWQLDKMFPNVPKAKFREHKWRSDVVTIGEVPAEFVSEVTEGIYEKSWPAQLNKLVWEGNHDLILSIGQVVPHEVIGMANYNKNVFIGTGGVKGINESHFIGAAYGMERMMGRADTPLRKILNYAQDNFCQHLPLLYVLTVVAANDEGELVTRGLFIGDDHDCFYKACELSILVNFDVLDVPLDKVVVYLDDEEFHSTWLGNKSIYRTRMAIADEGELIVLAPGVKTFGEDEEIDRLIRKYGYRTTPQVMQMMNDNEDLQNNLSAAAHLIHGSSEERFSVTYCPGHLSREEIEGVGYQYADLAELSKRYDPATMKEGWNTMGDGERVFYIGNPALGLWAYRGNLK
ncbi:MAG: nickel-dependent lactate racemase [Pirellulaceae bacterium]|jgi:nickel-dependent lactate racemase